MYGRSINRRSPHGSERICPPTNITTGWSRALWAPGTWQIFADDGRIEAGFQLFILANASRTIPTNGTIWLALPAGDNEITISTRSALPVVLPPGSTRHHRCRHAVWPCHHKWPISLTRLVGAKRAGKMKLQGEDACDAEKPELFFGHSPFCTFLPEIAPFRIWRGMARPMRQPRSILCNNKFVARRWSPHARTRQRVRDPAFKQFGACPPEEVD